MIDPEAREDQNKSVMDYLYKLESEVQQWRKRWDEMCSMEHKRIARDERSKYVRTVIPVIVLALLLGIAAGYVLGVVFR